MTTLTMSQSEKEIRLAQLEAKWKEKHPTGRVRKIVVDVKKEIDKVESLIDKAACYAKIEKRKPVYLTGRTKKSERTSRRSVFVKKTKNVFGSLEGTIRHLFHEDYYNPHQNYSEEFPKRNTNKVKRIGNLGHALKKALTNK